MSGLAAPEILDKIEVFRRLHARSFASVHGVSVVNLWSVLGRCAGKETTPSNGARHWQRDRYVNPPMLDCRLTEHLITPEFRGAGEPARCTVCSAIGLKRLR